MMRVCGCGFGGQCSTFFVLAGKLSVARCFLLEARVGIDALQGAATKSGLGELTRAGV